MSDDRSKDPRRDDDEPLEFVNREERHDVDFDEEDDFEELPNLNEDADDDFDEDDDDLEEFEAEDVDDDEPAAPAAPAAAAAATAAAAKAAKPAADDDAPPRTARPRKGDAKAKGGGKRKGPPVIMLAALGLIAAVALFMFWPRGGGVTEVGDGQSSVLTLPDTSAAIRAEIPTPRSSDVDLDHELSDVVPEESDGAAGAAARVDIKREAETRSGAGRELAEPEVAAASGTAPTRTETPPPARPNPGAGGVSGPGKDGAWAIQVGSFGDRANALRLTVDLQAKGYRVEIQDLGSTHKVWVGYFMTRTAAEVYAAARTADLGAKPYITHR